MSLINLFKNKKLQKELEEIKAALLECNEKLVEKQEHINMTNAYWKKKLHTERTKKASKKEL